MTADEMDEAAVSIMREMLAISREHARRVTARLRHAGLLVASDKLTPVQSSNACYGR